MESIFAEKFLLMKSNIPSFDILLHRLLVREQDDRMSFEEFFKVVFDKNFMINEDAFLLNFPKYKELYNKILIEENPVYPNLSDQEIKKSVEIEDEIVENKKNKNEIWTLVKGGNFPDIMSIPNGSINKLEDEEVFNNIIYYDENINYKNEVNRDSDYFERITPGAFILCKKKESLDLIKNEVVNQWNNEKKQFLI